MVDLIENESNKYAKRFYEKLVEEGYSVIDNSRYVNANTHVETKCSKEHEYKTTPNNFTSVGSRCSKCSNSSNTEQYKDKVRKLTGDDYTVLGEYKTALTHIKMRHNKCGFEYEIRPNGFLSGGVRCLKCYFPNYNRDTKQFKEEVRELEGDNYTVLSEYVNAVTHVKMRHNECENVWNIYPNNFIHSNNRCPLCFIPTSKGERLVESILNDNNLNYIPQDKFEECKNKYRLRFDFGVYSDDDELIALIEYQGEQHYKAIEYFGGDDSFERQILNDNIKREYCKENDIPLIEIKYSLTDEEVEEYLLSELST